MKELFSLIKHSMKLKVITGVVSSTILVGSVFTIYMYNQLHKDVVIAQEEKDEDSNNVNSANLKDGILEDDKKKEAEESINTEEENVSFENQSDDSDFSNQSTIISAQKPVEAPEATPTPVVEETPVPEATPAPVIESTPVPEATPTPVPEQTPTPEQEPVVNKKYTLNSDTEQWWRNHGIDIQSIEPFMPFHDDYNKHWYMIIDEQSYNNQLDIFWDQLFELIRNDFPNKQVAATGSYFAKSNGQSMYIITSYTSES